MMGKWEAMTGEKLSARDEWATVWGVRWGSSTDGQRQAPREEAYRVVHAAMVAAIHEERGKRNSGSRVVRRR